jgi:hypothetical protein
MDILSKITRALADYAAGLSPSTIQFWLRLVLLLTLPAATCAWTFLRGYRSVFLQVLAGVLGALVALSMPLQQVQISNGMVRLWLLTFTVVFVAFWPAVLPRLLINTLGAQRKLRNGLYAAVGLLILLNLILG